MATGQAIPVLNAETRDRRGSRYTARLRSEGRLPAVIYGHKKDVAHIHVSAGDIIELVHDHSHLMNVVIGDNTESCLFKDIQWDHLGANILHVDLSRVNLNEVVEVEVELVYHGDAVGLKEDGAYMEHPHQHITVSCVASNIPDSLLLELGELQVGETLTIADLKLPEGVTAVDEPETVLATISIAEELPEEEEGEEGAGEEPEVIGRADDEEEEGEDK